MIGRAWRWIVGSIAGLALLAGTLLYFRRKGDEGKLATARERDADSRAKTAGDLAKLGELKAREQAVARETPPKDRKQAEVDAELRRRGKIL